MIKIHRESFDWDFNSHNKTVWLDCNYRKGLEIFCYQRIIYGKNVEFYDGEAKRYAENCDIRD